MALAKGSSVLRAASSLAAGASVYLEYDFSNAVQGGIFVKLTNGASAPTTIPTIKFTIGETTGVKRRRFDVTGDMVANSITEKDCVYGLRDKFGGVTVTNGGTNSVTLEVVATFATA